MSKISKEQHEWIERYRVELWERKAALRSYQKLADELGVSKGTLQRFVKYGKVPASKELRDRIGYNPPKPPSRGKLIYDSRSEKARLKGWDSLSEFLTAVDNDEAEIPHKDSENIIAELSLQLQVASILNRNGGNWNIHSPFQNKINEFLIKSGREPVDEDTNLDKGE